MSQIKILVVSHSAITYTGLAECTRLIFGGVLNHFPHKYEIVQLGLHHISAVTRPRWRIYGTEMEETSGSLPRLRSEDINGEMSFGRLLEAEKPDIVFGFNDPQALRDLCVPRHNRNYKSIAYVTFDGWPIPDAYDHLQHVDRLITMSNFSRGVYLRQRESRRDISYIYAPADTQRFCPVSNEIKAEIRSDIFPAWLKEGSFVVGWVGRNQWRKQMWVMYAAIEMIRNGKYGVCASCGLTIDDKKKPTYCHCGSSSIEAASPLPEIVLWIHLPVGKRDGQWELDSLESEFHLKQGQDIHYTDGCSNQYHLPPDAMPLLYQSWDALLYLSGGEGFGIPAWEAMSCGIPVIYTNHSAHGEFLSAAGAGLPVSGILQPDPFTGIFRMVANVYEAVEQIRRCFYDRQLCSSLGNNGRRFVSGHSMEKTAERWDNIFTETRNSHQPA